MGRMFGTDGVRGIANTELTAELAYKLGRAGAYVLTEGAHKPTIIVGKDTRISGDMLESALVAGIMSVGAHAICVGVVPTPAVAYLTRKLGADAGVVISASHNPVEYNGIKFFNKDGYKLPDEVEDKIEEIINNGLVDVPSPTGEDLGVREHREDAVDLYIEFLKEVVGTRLDGMKIALDCAEGASYYIAPKVFKELGAEVFVIHNNPDGKNINKNCGSTHMNELKDFTVNMGCDLGLAFDGDADRCLAVDEKGNIINGDFIMTIIASEMKKQGKLDKDTLVVTVMSNMGLDIACKREGINTVKTKVGDRYVLEEMIKGGYKIGGEQSGHIIFLDHNTTGDGLITALKVAATLKNSGKKMSELASIMKELPQVLVNAKVSNEKKYAYTEDEVIVAEIEKLEKMLEGRGRVLIRPSGTEPLVRVMLEGENQEEIDMLAKNLAKLIEDRSK
ncbi:MULTISPECIES: phosphoglucosamine mutase [Caloramator]|uniref:Phosphoglucosamine mutase n=1 Tax=Caloramator proteoclasticus DSM 10124 TaxID=1121262 RepID=A0A1M4YQQ8_9CLOT|nr:MULTISPECIES: phosphoglucosamine mutase [Caloramator]SHF08134.1 phosphoglucosamine mutase [Caloramator proteoclasticus DSM 10124]